MTNDLHVVRAPDVFVENDVLLLSQEDGPEGLRLAGAAWLRVGTTPRVAHRDCLKHAASLVVAKLPGHVLWLLAGHTAWQPDSRVTRYRKLWDSLGTRGLAAPLGRTTAEHLVESAEGVRFFGGVELDLGSLDPVVAILEAEPISHLVALKVQDAAVAEGLVRGGWDGAPFGPSPSVLTGVCSVDGIVLSLVGAFDDREAGCVALGRPGVLDELLR